MNQALLLELREIQMALSHAMQDASLLESLTAFGYGKEKLEEGLQLCQAVLTAYEAQQKSVGQQVAATAAYNQAWDEASKRYTFHLMLARKLFAEDREAGRQLPLAGSQPQDYESWSSQSHLFYRVLLANEGYQQRMATVGVTLEKIASAAQGLDQLHDARLTQEARNSEAKRATRQRQASHEALLQWMSYFRQVARVALADRPEAKAKLRLTQSSRTKVASTSTATTAATSSESVS